MLAISTEASAESQKAISNSVAWRNILANCCKRASDMEADFARVSSAAVTIREMSEELTT